MQNEDPRITRARELEREIEHRTGHIAKISITGVSDADKDILERDWYQAIPLQVAAKIWNVHKSTVDRWAVEGKVVSWRPGHEKFVSAISMMRYVGPPANAKLLLATMPGLGYK